MTKQLWKKQWQIRTRRKQSYRLTSRRAYYSSQSRAKQGSKQKEWVDFDEKTSTAGKKSSAGKTGDRDADLTVCETKDLVKVGM